MNPDDPTNPQRFRLIDDLFCKAVDLPADARKAYLDLHCEGDPGLRVEVEKMLAADQVVGDRFERIVRGQAAEALEKEDPSSKPVRDPAIGQVLGHYRITEAIGAGGMGAVYKAERIDEEFSHSVAIKIVGNRVAAAHTLERLRAERQILASLAHENIARLHDGGTTEEGIPYIVMEYIDGLPIDQYCDQNQLSIDDRIKLFCAVCAGVHHAHQSLVVHRDIKPSNILVGSDGQPKLLDFGIAKLIDADSTEGLTAADQRMLTPEYASPEHVAGDMITTASDTYSLGVLLYKLLSGRLPYRFSGKSYAELLQVVQHSDPIAPSRAWQFEHSQDDQPSTQELAAARGSTPERCARALRGDLDNIIGMALRKEPERRYRSANQLAEDLGRREMGLPVAARPDTWSYRTGKFVRRHALGVVAASLAAVGLIVFSGLLWVGSQRTERALERAEDATAFLVDLFEQALPGALSPDDAAVLITMLKNSEKQLANKYAEQPELRADLLVALAKVYRSLSDDEAARRLAREALDLIEPISDSTDERNNEARLVLAQSLLDGDDDGGRQLEQATQMIDIALSGARRAGASEYEARAQYLSGQAQVNRREYDKAERALLEGIAIMAPLEDPDLALLAELNDALGQVYMVTDPSKAIEIYREMEALNNRRFDSPYYPGVSVNYHNLGVSLLIAGRLDEAESNIQKALDVMDQIYRPNHRDYSAVYGSMSRVQRRKHCYESAVLYASKARDVAHERMADNMHNYAYAVVDLGSAQRLAGQTQKAAASYSEAYEIQRTLLAENDQMLASTLYWHSKLHVDLGEHEAARVKLDQALQIYRANAEELDWHSARAQALLGYTYLADNNLQESLRLLKPATQALLTEAPGNDARREAIGWSADLYWKLEQTRDAQRMEEMLKELPPPAAPTSCTSPASISAGLGQE